MRGIYHLTGLLMITALLVVGCRRERSRVMGGEEQQDVMEGPRDYREMLERARAKQSTASILSDLENAIARFQYDTSRLPTNLNELVGRKYLNTIPTPPHGQGYVYDPIHGNVSLTEMADDSGLSLPGEATNLAPIRLQDVQLPARP